MGFYRAYNRYNAFGAFGDVAEAQDMVQTAQAKVTAINAQISAQKGLIAYSQRALDNCATGGGNIAANIITGGLSAIGCAAEQHTALDQRRGQLATLEFNLQAAKAELQNARAALTQARDNAAAGIVDTPLPSVGPSPIGFTSGSSSMTGSGGIHPGGGLMDMLSNPLVLGGAAIVGLGAVFLAFRKKG